LFLAVEVYAGELDEAVEDFGDALVAAAADQGETQLIEHIQEEAVLSVHGANADGAFGFPDEGSQGVLQRGTDRGIGDESLLMSGRIKIEMTKVWREARTTRG
jgi:hypothetical protein